MRKRKDLENETDEGDVYDEDEFVIYKTPDGTIKSCGFDVNSILLKQGKKPMYTIKNQPMFAIDDSKEEVSDLFKDMAVPAGLFYMKCEGNPSGSNDRIISEMDDDSDEDISEDIYEKLLNLVQVLENKEKKRKTRKRVLGGKRKTKKNFISKNK
jgi:hypothetical protein